MKKEDVVEIYTTEDEVYTLYQEKDKTKVFYLVGLQEDEVVGTFIPALENHRFEGQDGELPVLTGLLKEEDWYEKTGLAYIPECLLDIRFLEEDYLDYFNLSNKKHLLDGLGTEVGQKQESDIVEPLSEEGEKLRQTNTYLVDSTGNSSVFDLLHDSRVLVYELAALEKEMDIKQQEFEKSMEVFKEQQKVLIEKLETYDLCIKKILKEG